MHHSFSSSVTVAPDVILRFVREEAVLLNLKTELYVGFDPVATRMWTVLTESPSIQVAYETLLKEYDVESTRLREELNVFLNDLLEQGLIRLSPGIVNTSAA
jgi:Coenzyme PQQ synthesis protein D (PqqD)